VQGVHFKKCRTKKSPRGNFRSVQWRRTNDSGHCPQGAASVPAFTTGRDQRNYRLNSRENEVLALLVDGLSYKMIAARLNITYDTVRAHMKKIYEKLHVTSMTEAVAKTINQKLFSV